MQLSLLISQDIFAGDPKGRERYLQIPFHVWMPVVIKHALTIYKKVCGRVGVCSLAHPIGVLLRCCSSFSVCVIGGCENGVDHTT